MELTSPDFAEGQPIPRDCSCDGSDRSPGLAWSDVPLDTASFALICEDPDAPSGTWDHWVYYDLPADARGLSAGVPPVETPPGGGTQGKNDFKKIGYGGPCPPGGTHRYFFRLYALGRTLNLDPGASSSQLERALQDHVLAEARLMGTYRRR